MRWLANWIIRHAESRPPTQIIGGAEHTFMRRWCWFPKNRWFNIYTHQILRDDDDRALHDHPWMNCSIVLRYGYEEVRKNGVRYRGPGSIVIRMPRTAHRLLLLNFAGEPQACWTLFIIGPKVREWGFHCPRGWVHWKDFCAPDNENEVGPGCDGDVTVPVFTYDPGQMDRKFIEDSRKSDVD